MGLRDRFSRSRKEPAGEVPGAGEEGSGAPDGGLSVAPADEMPTLVHGAPVPGTDGPEDQTFITPAQEFAAAPDGDPGAAGAPAFDEAHLQEVEVQPHPQPQPPSRPGFRERGRLRRRLRYLREVRELGYRDLGGLVLDQHRFQRPNEELVAGKVEAIEGLDREMRAIEHALNESTPYTELFIPGLSACPRCGALHGSDARFCPQCGLSFKGPRTVAGVGTPEQAPGAPPAPGYPPPPGGAAPGAYAPPPSPAPYPAPAPEPIPPAPPVEPAHGESQPPQETEVRPPGQPAE